MEIEKAENEQYICIFSKEDLETFIDSLQCAIDERSKYSDCSGPNDFETMKQYIEKKI